MLNKIIPFRGRIQMWVTYASPGNTELGNKVENENFPYVSFLWVHCCCEKWIGFKLFPNSTLLASIREGSQTVSGAIWDGDRVGGRGPEAPWLSSGEKQARVVAAARGGQSGHGQPIITPSQPEHQQQEPHEETLRDAKEAQRTSGATTHPPYCGIGCLFTCLLQ